jgi:flagellar biosynthetic protein FliR
MDLVGLSPEEFKSLILILIRISIVMFLLPFFGGVMVPKMVKAGLALMITIVLFPVVRPAPGLFPDSVLASVNLVLSELVLGLILGLILRLFFAAVQLAGTLVGYQMGFALANVIDPESGQQGSLLANIGYWIAILIFLSLDGHHLLLNVLVDSFSIVEVGSLSIGVGIFERMAGLSRDMFSMAVKIGAPAIAALLFVSAAFGIIAKFVPQMNILIVAFPLKIGVGLFFFGFCLEILHYFMRQYLAGFEGMLNTIMKLVRV